jgi:hypothetical protein
MDLRRQHEGFDAGTIPVGWPIAGLKLKTCSYV